MELIGKLSATWKNEKAYYFPFEGVYPCARNLNTAALALYALEMFFKKGFLTL